MKKRTLVCFLIFILCAFYSSLPGTVFGQAEDPTPTELAKQVFNEHKQVLLRASVKQYLPEIIEGLKTSTLPIVTLIDIAINSVNSDPTGATLIGLAAAQGITLTQDHINLIADADVQGVLKDDTTVALLSLTGADLAAGLDELLRLINETDAIEPPPPPVDPTPPTLSITISPPTTAQEGSFDIVFATAAGNTVSATISSVVPVEATAYYNAMVIGSSVRVTQTAPTEAVPTIPGATVILTLTANDGTLDSTPETFVVTFATVTKPVTPPPDPPDPPPVDPTPPTPGEWPDLERVDSNLNGKSRLGGLSLNRIYARGFIRDLIIKAAGGKAVLDALNQDPDALVEPVVDFILAQVPKGFLPKKQIKQILTATQPSSIFFSTEKDDMGNPLNIESQLDFENFGNAILPDLSEVLYHNVGNTTKYLASDRMNVYVRVPSTLPDGQVVIGINNGEQVVNANRIVIDEFQKDTIPYTFRLDETLAATNLPAWPNANFDTQIFSDVKLRFAQTEEVGQVPEAGDYFSRDMMAMHDGTGWVWEFDIGLQRKGSVYYYFEVTLAEPVMLEMINFEALGDAVSQVQLPEGELPKDATNSYRIEKWVMPDPHNLQLADHGLFDTIFSDEVAAEITRILTPHLSSILAGNLEDIRIPGRDIQRLSVLLLQNVNSLLTEINDDYVFDPGLTSVFSVPQIVDATDSFWHASIDSLRSEVNTTLEARVLNAAGELVDQIIVGDEKSEFKVDYTAPEADINIDTLGVAKGGYLNKDGFHVYTAEPADMPASLDITSTVTQGVVGNGQGYLVYQCIVLDEQGRPLSTWMPLTVENSTMVATGLWNLVVSNLPDNLKEIPIPGSDVPLDISLLPLDLIISGLKGEIPIPGVNNVEDIIINAIKDVGITITGDQYRVIVDLLEAVVDDLNALPITADPSQAMMIPLQLPEDKLEELGLSPDLPVHFGVRALGIDTLFNVSSHKEPARIRVVAPEWDRTSIMSASLGDLNGNGNDGEPYESGISGEAKIFRNATEVTFTVAINDDGRSTEKHPAMIMVQYQDATGTWQTIGALELAEGADTITGSPTVMHDFTDFADLLGADDVIRLRTVTTNGLELTDTSEEFTLTIVDDVHPVDPKVLVVDADDASLIDETNPDSGAPQGEITLIAYTPLVTYPDTTSIKLEVMRVNDDGWTIIDTEAEGVVTSEEIAVADMMFNGVSLGEIYPSDTSMIHIDETSRYLKWTITVDTTTLPDTIDMGNLAAAHAASNPDGKSYVELDNNRYMVRATPVVDGDLPDNPNEDPVAEGETYTDTFSVDNVDDVSPLGQNMITVSQDGVDVTPNEDGSFDVGGLVDKYDPEVDSPVITLTITPGAKRDTYQKVNLYTSLPEGTIIGEVTETAAGGEFEVTIDVGTLMNDDGLIHTTRYLEDVYHANPDELIYNPKGEVFSFTVYALTEDAAGNEQDKDDILNADLSTTTAHEITVNVENFYRPDPGVLAITVDKTENTTLNPDSGAPQGELAFSVYTFGRTSAPTEGIRVEVQRPIDDTWERITGTAKPSEIVNVSEVPVADLSDILTDAANAGIISSGVIGVLVDISEAEGGSPTTLMKWSYVVDTRELAKLDAPDDAIKLDDTINRGDGDSERDVNADENRYTVRAYALTPQNQNQVEYPKRDEYLERGGVEAHFSLDNVDDVPPLGPTLITDISDVAGSLAASEDGIYPEVITVGGIVDPGVESPVAIFTIQPTAEMKTYEGGQIRLVQTAPDGTETLLPPVHVDEGQITVDVGVLPDGIYMYYALVGDNVDPTNWQVQGELDRPSPMVSVKVLNISVRDIYDVDDNLIRESNITDLTVTAVDGASPDRLPLQETVGELEGRFPLKESISVSFNVNNGSLTVDELTGVLVDGHESTFAAGSDAENAFSLMGSELSALADGWYTPQGRITKRNGSVTFPLATINLDNTGPMIVIEIPTEGATVSDLPTLLASFSDGDLGSGVSDGSGVSAADTAVVSLARLRPEEVVQDAVSIDVDQDMVEQNLGSVAYTRIDQLAGGAYQFTVSVEDRLGNSEPVTVTFAVEGDDPVVVVTAPASGQTLDFSPEKITGFFSGGGEVTITSFTINGVDVTPDVDGNNFVYAPEEALAQGDHTVEVEVADGNGVTAQTALTFTVDTPGPTVAIHAVEMYDISKPVINGEFSGHAEVVSLDLTLNGESVSATEGDGTFEFTPAEPLDDGEFTLVAVVTDANGKTAKATSVFNIRLPIPTVSIASPQAGNTYDHTYRHISGEFSGAGEITVSLMVDDNAVEAMVDGNQFTHTLADKLTEGEHTVSVSIVDANGNTAKTSATFLVVYPDATVSITSPIAGDTYDHTYRHISGEFTGVGEVSVSLMVDGSAVEAMVSGNEFTYDLSDKLAEGSHTVSVMVTDANGETAEASTTFSVVYPEATVSITSPVAGDTYDHTYRHISGEFTGVGEVSVSLMVDGSAVEAMVSGNEFTYDLSDKLAEGSHTVSVMVTDANGETAEASTTFSVVYPGASVSISSPVAGDTYDHTYRHISGEFTGVGEVSVSLMVDGSAVEAMVSGNEFTYDLSDKLTEGEHTVSVMVTDANGETAEASTMFSVAYPAASVSIASPIAGDTYDHTYRHISGEFTGVGEVSVSLMVDGSAVDAMIDGNEFTYDLPDKLTEGEHTVSVMVTDANGETAEASTMFSVAYPAASVSISSPEAGDTHDHTYRHISGEFTGVGEVSVSLMVDGSAVEAMVEGNEFTYDLSDKLAEGVHTVSVMVTDANGEMAEASTTFSVVYPDASVSISSPEAGDTYDHTYRHISGEFTGVDEVSVSLMVDGAAVEAMVSGNEFTYDLSDKLAEGSHTVSVMVTDANGETAEASTTFSVVYPDASVSIASPVAGDTYDHTYRHISGEFTGVGEVSVSLMVDGAAVEAMVSGNEFTYDLSDKLAEGEHTVSVMVTDANGETAEASTTFSVVYPDVSVSISSPEAGDTYDHTYRHISGEFTGVGEVSVSLMVDGTAVDAMVEGNEFTYDLSDKLAEGIHTVSVMVTDANGETAEASTTFSVVYPDASVSIASPVAGDTYDHTYRHISGEFTGVGEVSVSLMVDGTAVDAMVEGNQFTHTLTDKLAEGNHTVSVMVTDANGETATAESVFSIVYPAATVTLQSPSAGHTYVNGSPVINGEFTGVGAVEVKLSVDGNDIGVSVDGNQFTGELGDALSHGVHTITAQVTDANGESAMTSVDFIVDLPEPTVTILSPAPAQTYGNGEAVVIRVEYAGMDASVTSFTINGEDVEVEPEDNMFMHTPEGLTTGEYIIDVVVTDAANKKTARDTVVFNVKLDDTPPVISEVAPSGMLKDTWVNISVVVSDEQSPVNSVLFYIRNEADVNKGYVPLGSVSDTAASSASASQIASGHIEMQHSFPDGTHSLRVVASSEGGTTTHTWSFTVVTDNIKPTITSITPSGTIHAGLPTISASAHDESGVAEIVITVRDDSGEEVAGIVVDGNEPNNILNDREANVTGITRQDFIPENPLDEGTYSIEVRATDTYENTSSAKGWFSIDFDTAAPIITSSAPHNEARLMYKYNDVITRPTVSITFGDSETGVNVDSIKLVIEAPKNGGGRLVAPIDLTDEQKSASQVLYQLSTPAFPDGKLAEGKYTVKLEVSDNAHKQGNVSDESDSARQANTTVYQFSFFVEYSDVPILRAAPFNYPNPFVDNTRISFVLARRSNVSITIYDATLRPVRVLVDNEIMEAGYYTPAADSDTNPYSSIGWDGKSSNGEDLARGIYFCQIMVTDGVEPEYAILKLALTR